MSFKKLKELDYESHKLTKRGENLSPRFAMRSDAQFGLGLVFCLISAATIFSLNAPFLPFGEALATFAGLLATWGWCHVHRKWLWRWFSLGVLSGLGLLGA